MFNCSNKQEFNKICGDTPLIKVSEKLYAKLETYNPTGSVKDRMISYVVSNALSVGLIVADTILCEATSGNSGISLSAIAASMGLRCVIFMPSNMSEERKQMMRVYGAEIVEAPPGDFETAIKMRDDFLLANPGSWSPMQFSNPENIECHQNKTAPEIAMALWLMNEKWSAFIHGSGTGGTIEGVRRYLQTPKGFIKKEDTPPKVCMVIPAESPHGIQGIGDGRDFLAKQSDMDGIIHVKTEDAINRAKLFVKESGILIGISSGANLVASERWIEENNPCGVVVTLLCDRGERYLTLFEHS
jgi:cysteine synthase A